MPRRRQPDESTLPATPKDVHRRVGREEPKDSVCRLLKHRPVQSLAEHLLRRHLTCDAFRIGLDHRLWSVIEINWPYATFGLNISSRRSVEWEHSVRLHLQQYPVEPPVLQLWDRSNNFPVAISQWPEWFTEFLTEAFPHLVSLPLIPYQAGVLGVSAAIAARISNRPRGLVWDPAGDVTQLLFPLLMRLRLSEAKRDQKPYSQRSIQLKVD